MLFQQGTEGLIVVEGSQKFILGIVLSQGYIQRVHAGGGLLRQCLPQSGGGKVPGGGQQAADVVLMDVRADHQVDMSRAAVAQILRQGETTGGAVGKLFGLGAASVNDHDEHTVCKTRIGTFQQDGLAVSDVYKGQFHMFHRHY